MSHRTPILLAVVATAGLATACSDSPQPADTTAPATPQATRPPPPISGGTLLVAADGVTAIAADPDRDRVLVADLAKKSLLADIALVEGDEPGRVVEGPPGRVHVALRRAGDVATIDLASRKLVRRTHVCASPRGLAYDAAHDAVHVACVGGDLVTISAEDGAEQRRIRLEPDLRDVVLQGDHLFVSQFRSATVLVVDADGSLSEVRHVEGWDGGSSFAPEVAWRTLALPSGGIAMVHQRAGMAVVPTTPGGYSSPSPSCNGSGIVQTAVSFFDADVGDPLGSDATGLGGPSIKFAVLPVDLAVSKDGFRMAVVAAGTSAVYETPISAYRADAPQTPEACAGLAALPFAVGQPIAAAYRGSDLVVQTREPPALVFRDGSTIALPGESVFDVGHELFHRPPAATVACASCHPEGRDDGRVWHFDEGLRRTPSVAGGVLATAPFHWTGSLDGFDSLMNEVLTKRMGGEPQTPQHVLALATWLDAVPLPQAPPTDNPGGVQRGEAIFESAGCTACHSGPRLTNNTTVDVGTGGAFQVPSLRGVGLRAPYMHDGCAPTLRDRFTSAACGGGDAHGHTSQLTSDQVDDLVAYLETL